MNRPLPLLACIGALSGACGTSTSPQPAGSGSAVASSTSPSEVTSASAAPTSSAVPLASASAQGPRHLRFRGTVTAIDAARAGAPPDRSWVVTMRVEQILDGAFAGATFAFRVHSPSRAGLVVGGTYLVEAQRTGEGYAVDELQWRRR